MEGLTIPVINATLLWMNYINYQQHSSLIDKETAQIFQVAAYCLTFCYVIQRLFQTIDNLVNNIRRIQLEPRLQNI